MIYWLTQVDKFFNTHHILFPMVSAEDVGERELIRKLMNVIRPCPFPGQMDDAVVVDDHVFCTDIVSFERHMSKGMSFEEFGWMAAAVNLSDIASMGAEPVGILAALSIPRNLDESVVMEIMSGIDRCAEAYDTFVIGGDTKFGQGTIAGTAIGRLDGRPPLLRSGARPGDVIAVTGSLGSAAAGYHAIENAIPGVSMTALRTPTPRISEGLVLSISDAVTSCMDLSDGLAEGAKGICSASHVGMDIHMDFLPKGKDVDRVSDSLCVDVKDLMLYWGGDYELLFTFDKDKMEQLYEYDIEFSVIGKVTNSGCPYIIENNEGTVMKDGRY